MYAVKKAAVSLNDAIFTPEVVASVSAVSAGGGADGDVSSGLRWADIFNEGEDADVTDGVVRGSPDEDLSGSSASSSVGTYVPDQSCIERWIIFKRYLEDESMMLKMLECCSEELSGWKWQVSSRMQTFMKTCRSTRARATARAGVMAEASLATFLQHFCLPRDSFSQGLRAFCGAGARICVSSG